MDAKNIYLVGFDFNSAIGKYSFGAKKDLNKKKKKLLWSKNFLEERLHNKIVYL